MIEKRQEHRRRTCWKPPRPTSNSRPGRFAIAGTDRRIGIMELAATSARRDRPARRPAERLDVDSCSPRARRRTFPNGCHVAEVEVDPETGVVEVVDYTMVNDFGVLVNPLLVDGQIAWRGRAGHRPGAAWRACVYDADGQLLTGSFMDYALPRAGDVPDIVVASHPVPAKTNPLGVKGCGEAGCAGALPSVMNAVVDALSEFGITHIDMPATPERVWRSIEDARSRATATAT